MQSDTSHSDSAPADASHGQGDISFLETIALLARHAKFVLGLPLALGVAAAVVSLLLPNWFSATARIMPPQQSQSNAVAILGQLGALAGGSSQALGLKNPSDIYVVMLKSRSVADKLIQRFNLKEVYDEDTLHFTRLELAKRSTVGSGKEGVITIEVEDRDPQRAATIANAYIEELRDLTVNLAISEASQRRLFFEAQLRKTRTDLSTVEAELRNFSQSSGLISPQGQIGLSVAAAAALRAQITAKEIQLSAMRSYATEANPELARTLRELEGLRSQLAKLEKNSVISQGDVLIPFGKAPEYSLEYVRKYRDFKYFETLYEVLGKQYEIARIDEAKDATLIQVLDNAVVPDRKVRPKRLLIVAVAVLAGLFASASLILMGHTLLRASRTPSKATELERLGLLKLVRRLDR